MVTIVCFCKLASLLNSQDLGCTHQRLNDPGTSDDPVAPIMAMFLPKNEGTPPKIGTLIR